MLPPARTGAHVVHANNLHALRCQAERGSDCRIGAIGVFVADELFPESPLREWPTNSGQPSAWNL